MCGLMQSRDYVDIQTQFDWQAFTVSSFAEMEINMECGIFSKFCFHNIQRLTCVGYRYLIAINDQLIPPPLKLSSYEWNRIDICMHLDQSYLLLASRVFSRVVYPLSSI